MVGCNSFQSPVVAKLQTAWLTNRAYSATRLSPQPDGLLESRSLLAKAIDIRKVTQHKRRVRGEPEFVTANINTMASSVTSFSTLRARSYVFRLPLFTRIVLLVIIAAWIAGFQSVWRLSEWGALIPDQLSFTSCWSSPLQTYSSAR